MRHLATGVVFALTMVLLAGPGLPSGSACAEVPPGSDFSEASDYATAKTLKQAIDICKAKLDARGKPEYSALLSEQRVREAIRVGLKSYEVGPNKLKDNPEGHAKYFDEVVKPVYLKIAKDGVWPENCHFSYFFALSDKNGVSYDGLGLRLLVSTPGENFHGFGLPVVDLFYGRFND